MDLNQTFGNHSDVQENEARRTKNHLVNISKKY